MASETRVNLYCMGVLVHSEFAAPAQQQPRWTGTVRLLKTLTYCGVTHEAGTELQVRRGPFNYWSEAGHGCGFYVAFDDCEEME